MPRITPSKHYRLVIGVVGRRLTTFTNTKELVKAVRDAMEAHWKALSVAKLLHSDISIGNIIIVDGKGLLIDWEMAKDLDEVAVGRRHDRMGTWQFMSAALLEGAGKKHDLTDALESFLHVLGWIVLRYLPAVDEYEIEECRYVLKMFDANSPRGSYIKGGTSKADKLGGGAYPCETFKPRKPTPLHGLLRTLASPFKSVYSREHPTERERVECNVLPSLDDESALLRWAFIRQYNKAMERLQSSEWFIETIEAALSQGDWPSDDKADNINLESCKRPFEYRIVEPFVKFLVY